LNPQISYSAIYAAKVVCIEQQSTGHRPQGYQGKKDHYSKIVAPRNHVDIYIINAGLNPDNNAGVSYPLYEQQRLVTQDQEEHRDGQTGDHQRLMPSHMELSRYEDPGYDQGYDTVNHDNC